MKKSDLKTIIREIINEITKNNDTTVDDIVTALAEILTDYPEDEVEEPLRKTLLDVKDIDLKELQTSLVQRVKDDEGWTSSDIRLINKLSKEILGVKLIGKINFSESIDAINETEIKLPKKGITLSTIDNPNVKDWEVYTEGHPALFFSAKDSRDDVRSAYAQHEKVKFTEVRASKMTPEALKTQFKQEEDEKVSLIAAKRIVSNGPIRDTVAKMIDIEGYNNMDLEEKKKAVIEKLSSFSKTSFLGHNVYNSSRTFQAKRWVEKPEKIKPRKGLALDHEIKEMIRTEIKNLLKEN